MTSSPGQRGDWNGKQRRMAVIKYKSPEQLEDVTRLWKAHRDISQTGEFTGFFSYLQKPVFNICHLLCSYSVWESLAGYKGKLQRQIAWSLYLAAVELHPWWKAERQFSEGQDSPWSQQEHSSLSALSLRQATLTDLSSQTDLLKEISDTFLLASYQNRHSRRHSSLAVMQKFAL